MRHDCARPRQQLDIRLVRVAAVRGEQPLAEEAMLVEKGWRAHAMVPLHELHRLEGHGVNRLGRAQINRDVSGFFSVVKISRNRIEPHHAAIQSNVAVNI